MQPTTEILNILLHINGYLCADVFYLFSMFIAKVIERVLPCTVYHIFLIKSEMSLRREKKRCLCSPYINNCWKIINLRIYWTNNEWNQGATTLSDTNHCSVCVGLNCYPFNNYNVFCWFWCLLSNFVASFYHVCLTN